MKVVFSLADQNLATTMSVGIFNVSIGILRALFASQDCPPIQVLSNPSLRPFLSGLEGISIRESRVPLMGLPGRLFWDQWLLPRIARRSEASWVFLPKGIGPISRIPDVRMAAFVHDIMPVFYEDRYPGSYGKHKQRYFTQCYRATLEHAAVVFTNTAFTATEIQSWAKAHCWKCPRILIAGYGFDPTRQAIASQRDAVILLVRAMPHKRSGLALRYMDAWQSDTGFEGEVIVLGALPVGVSMPNRKNWTHTPWLDPQDCTNLFQRASRVVHFTEYEGFGMPPVEAALAGAVPVYSDIPVQREVMAGTGCPFSNDSYASFVSAMKAADEISDATIQEWSQTLHARHNWSRVARTILDVLHQKA